MAPVDGPERPRPGVAGTVWRGVAALPTLLPLAIAGYGLVAVLAVLTGEFRPALVLPLGTLAAVGAVLAGGLPESVPGREQRWVDAAMLAFVAIDALANAHYAAQDVTVYRDPGVYAVTGAWLVHHHSLVI
ncbi:MAG: hypothetical protein ACYDB7_05915, partial [Mycobacteriales bacterium]